MSITTGYTAYYSLFLPAHSLFSPAPLVSAEHDKKVKKQNKETNKKKLQEYFSLQS